MAVIAIKGVRVDSLTLNLDKENVQEQISATYALISTADRVLAKQSIGGYSDVKIPPSLDTIKALQAFVESYKRDINTALGLDAE